MIGSALRIMLMARSTPPSFVSVRGFAVTPGLGSP